MVTALIVRATPYSLGRRIILHARLCGLLQTIAFKVPNDVVASKEEGRYFAHWEPDGKVYSLQVQFKPPSKLA